jgi:hypothetical protein
MIVVWINDERSEGWVGLANWYNHHGDVSCGLSLNLTLRFNVKYNITQSTLSPFQNRILNTS